MITFQHLLDACEEEGVVKGRWKAATSILQKAKVTIQQFRALDYSRTVE